MNPRMKELRAFIGRYSLVDVLELESKDLQYLAVESAWKGISINSDQARCVFLMMVIQAAVVSYQIAGSGPLWRTEIAANIQRDFDVLMQLGANNHKWRKEMLQNSRYNRRLPVMKAKRIQKSLSFFPKSGSFYQGLFEDIDQFNHQFSLHMGQKPNAKTVTFTTKMLGYAMRIVYQKPLFYPFTLSIPVDSRLKKIYGHVFGYFEANDRKIQLFFDQLGRDLGLPPLHLDILLWGEFYKKLRDQK